MALAQDKVRYVGDPVAVVVAETAVQARDAAEAVLLDIDPLPAVTTARAAAAPGAPLVHEGVPGNIAHGLPPRRRRRRRRRLRPRGARHDACPSATAASWSARMEPRSALAEFDAGDWTLHAAGGLPGRVRACGTALKDVLGVPREQVRVLTGNVGGSFGMKAAVYPEYPCLLLAARLLGRPVKWTDERSDSFLSDSHGRDHEVDARAGAGRGRARSSPSAVTGCGNCGAYLTNADHHAADRRTR